MMNRRVLTLLVVLCLVRLWQPAPAWAATMTVTTTVDELSTNGLCSLREAIRNANANAALHPDCPAGNGADRISLPAGTYTLTIAGKGESAAATGDLDLSGELEILGASAATTIIEAGPEGGGRIDRVFDVQIGASVTISGVTIRRGNPGPDPDFAFEASGGGIRSASNLTITDAVIRENIAASFFQPINLANAYGGGIYLSSVSPVSLTVRRTTVTGNSATADGGGITFTPPGGTLTVEASTIDGNSAGYDGGGLDLDRGTTTVTNSTISGNQAVRSGGGVNNNGATVSIVSSTIAGNTASRGSGIDNNTSGAISVRTTIIANSGSGNCAYFQLSAATSLGSNLSSDNTCKFDAASDLNGVNPLLGALADNGGPTQTRMLQTGSPAIDAVQEACPPPAADQRDIARPLDGNGDGMARCDIGAFEAPAVLSATPTPTPTAPAVATTGTPTPTPEAIRAPSDDDKTVRSNRKPSEDVQRQQEHTNKGNRDDSFTEGDVIEVHADAVPPYVVLANRDGPVVVQLIGPAAQMAGSIRIGDYVEVEGVKQNEGLFEADNLTISR